MGNVVALSDRRARAHSTRRTDTHTPAGHLVDAVVEDDLGVYTAAETAYLLSLTLGATYALLRSGDIPACKVGGQWLIPKERLHAWVNQLPEATEQEVEREVARIERAHRKERP